MNPTAGVILLSVWSEGTYFRRCCSCFFLRRPNFSRFLYETVALRCRERLAQIRQLFASIVDEPPRLSCVGDSDALLVYRLFPMQDVAEDEHLHLGVSAFTGRVQAMVSALKHRHQDLLNSLALLIEQALDAQFHPHTSSVVSTAAVEELLDVIRLKLWRRRYLEALCGVYTRPVLAQQAALVMRQGRADIPAEGMLLQGVLDSALFLLVTFEFSADKQLNTRFFLLHNDPGHRPMCELKLQDVLRQMPLPALDFITDNGE